MPIERHRVLYRGRVQGVGFRYTAHRLARDYVVAGFVRNLRDGGVELVVEGEDADVSAYLASIDREMGRSIRETQVEKQPPGEPPLVGFSILF